MRLPVKTIMATVALLTLTAAINAQITTNPPYTINQSVLASGGETSADAANTYKVEGTIGQTVAGPSQISGSYSIQTGFWTPALLAPTAAGVSIGGRVIGIGGEGLRNISVTLSGGNLFVPRRTRTGSFGYFAFDDVPAGHTYLVTVENKKYGFAQGTQIFSVVDSVADLIFQASWEN